MITASTSSVDETRSLGERLSAALMPGVVLVLIGVRAGTPRRESALFEQARLEIAQRVRVVFPRDGPVEPELKRGVARGVQVAPEFGEVHIWPFG